MPTGRFQATVLITTKNRREDLRGALRSALGQTARCEVLVIDDGSSDGTEAMVRQEFPAVRLERSEQSRGYIVQRNRGASLASANVVFSIDDDAAFSTPQTVAQTLAEFDHPRIGAVAIPFVDVRKSPEVKQRAPDGDRRYVYENYIGTAHALRRDVFLRLGGYREFLFHQGEERDYCLRMLGAGYVTRLGRADPIHHFESPQRSSKRMAVYGRRNDVLYAWYNVPWLHLPVHLAGTAVLGVRHGLRRRTLPWMLEGQLRGLGACAAQWRRRRPVSLGTYRLARRLRHQGPLTLEAIESDLPPPAALVGAEVDQPWMAQPELGLR